MYQPIKPSRSEFLEFRGLRHHVRHWGPEDAPPLVLLHGWIEVSGSFQFMVDALKRDWRIIAPDWRGFGLSQWNDDAYWFPDYCADLDRLLDHYLPDQSVPVVGHSMGGIIATIYAGLRPERVSRLVTLEGFGLIPPKPDEAVQRYRKWLDDVRGMAQRDESGRGSRGFHVYDDHAAFSRRLMRDNPRLRPDRAAFLAHCLGQVLPDGRITAASDPWHKVINPYPFRVEDTKALWRQVTAKVLWVAARNSFITEWFAPHQEDYAERKAAFADLQEVWIENCGHNLHHDQPEQVAALVEGFLE